MKIFAQLINNNITGLHKSFSVQPPQVGNERWVPVIYGQRNPTFNPLSQKISAIRTLSEDKTSLLYEEIVEALPVEEARNNKLEDLKKKRDLTLSSGFWFNGNKFQTRNQADISNIISIGLAAISANTKNVPFSVSFISEENISVEMNGEQAEMFYLTMLTEGQKVWSAYTIAREQINDVNKSVDEFINIEMDLSDLNNP